MASEPSADTATEAAPTDSGSGGGGSRVVARLARWGIAIVLLGAGINLVLAWQSIRSGADRAFDSVTPTGLLLVALVGLLPTLFNAARLRLWARFFDAPITRRQALRVSMGTDLGSSVSPKLIGGAPVKVAFLIESGVPPGTAASMLLLDNFADIIFFTVVGPVIALVSARWRVPEVQEILLRVLDKVVAATPWLIGVALILWLVLRWRRSVARQRTARPGGWRGKLRSVRRDFFDAYRLVGQRGKLRLLAAIGFTSGVWIARCSVATALMFVLGRPVDPILFFLLQWVVFMLMVFVPTPGASIGAEASFAAVVDGFVAEGILGVVTAGWRFFSFYVPLLVGLAVMPWLRAPGKPKTL